MSPWTRLVLPPLALVVVVMVVVVGALVTRGDDETDGEPHAGAATGNASSVEQAAREFLDTYVEDGRVVRHDQGGDTVSEGQAYAMLLAVAVGDEDTFREVWAWTEDHLRRTDGLLSWRWSDGEVADDSSASDADLDAARALVLAGRAFDDDSLASDGVALGTAILDHETVPTPAGRVLVAGSWATSPPYAVNPSYVSPAAFWLLAKRSGDPRWSELDRGSAAAVEAVTADGDLPPDWATIREDGSGSPAAGPTGRTVQFGYDAARTLIRFAESCDGDDRAFVRSAGAAIADDDPVAAAYDLSGSPRTSDRSPLTAVAQASVLAVEGRADRAGDALGAASEISDRSPTYYGDAWAALGPIMLRTDLLGGCPPLGS